MAKILRRKVKGSIYTKMVVKGILLDKTSGSLVCALCIDNSSSNRQSNYMLEEGQAHLLKM